jgi:hypothetical protein
MSTTIFVYTMNRTGEVGAWSRYVLPMHVDNFCQMADHLYIRAGDDVLMVDETSDMDYKDHASAQPFDGIVQWAWLDEGSPGITKQMLGLDIATMRAINVEVEIGYDQSDKNAFTDPYSIPGDTIPGTFIPLPVMAPSLSIRLTFSSFDFWQFQAITLYLNPQAITA